MSKLSVTFKGGVDDIESLITCWEIIRINDMSHDLEDYLSEIQFLLERLLDYIDLDTTVVSVVKEVFHPNIISAIECVAIAKRSRAAIEAEQ